MLFKLSVMQVDGSVIYASVVPRMCGPMLATTGVRRGVCGLRSMVHESVSRYTVGYESCVSHKGVGVQLESVSGGCWG